jgi:hypothetical protein
MNNDGSNPVVTACQFTGNGAYRGGGMGNDGGSQPTVINCAFISNHVQDAGGGIFNVSNPANYLKLINCTFTGNVASRFGGMYNGSGSATKVTNCILWGDKPDEIGGTGTATVTVGYSDIANGSSWLSPGSHNITQDPEFSNGTICLSSGSPCIDAGHNAAVPGTITTDLFGNPRFVNCHPGSGTPAIVDMGACEFQCPPAPMSAELQRGNPGGRH